MFLSIRLASDDIQPEEDSFDAAVLMYDLDNLINNSQQKFYVEAANYSQILKKRFNRNIPMLYLRNKFDVDIADDQWVKNVSTWLSDKAPNSGSGGREIESRKGFLSSPKVLEPVHQLNPVTRDKNPHPWSGGHEIESRQGFQLSLYVQFLI